MCITKNFLSGTCSHKRLRMDMFTTIDIQGLLFKRQHKNIINLILKTINIDSELSFFFTNIY